jgi:hypothetical protein
MKIPDFVDHVPKDYRGYIVHSSCSSKYRLFWLADTFWAGRLIARRLLKENLDLDWTEVTDHEFNTFGSRCAFYYRNTKNNIVEKLDDTKPNNILTYLPEWHKMDTHAHECLSALEEANVSHHLRTPHGRIHLLFYNDTITYTKYWDNEVRFVGL